MREPTPSSPSVPNGILEHALGFGREDTAGVLLSCVALGAPAVERCAERVGPVSSADRSRSIATAPALTMCV